MKTRSIIYGVVIGTAAIVVVVSIVNSNVSDDRDRIRVAFFPNVGHAVPIVGLEKGFFAESIGNQTKLETKLFDSGPQVIESLFANSIDMAYVGPGPAVNGFLKSDSNNIVILAGAASGGASFVVHPDSVITSVADFPGKRIAAPQIANTQDVSLRHFMAENNLKPAEKGGSVVVLNIPNPEIYTLFTKGDIDAAWVPEPWATIFVNDLGGTRLFYEEELWPENKFASVLLVARSDFVKNNPLLVQKWLVAHDEAVDWINSNPEQTQIIFNSFVERELGQSFSAEIINESLKNIEITSDPIKSSVFNFAERANALGYLGRHGYDLEGIFYGNFSNLEPQGD